MEHIQHLLETILCAVLVAVVGYSAYLLALIGR